MADGDAGPAGTVDVNTPEIQAAIREAIDAEVSGLKTKNTELIGKLKDSSERLKVIDALGGEDGIKQLSEMRVRLEQDEDLKLFAEGKHEAYNERVLKRATADYQKQLEARDARIAEIDGELSATKQRLQSQIINDEIRSAASKAEMIPGAIEDALLHASRVFSLDENGQIIARNAAGDLDMGKDGKPLGIGEWLESMRESRAHWWPAQGGMGSRPSTSGASAPRSWSDAKTTQEKADFLAKKHKIKAV